MYGTPMFFLSSRLAAPGDKALSPFLALWKPLHFPRLVFHFPALETSSDRTDRAKLAITVISSTKCVKINKGKPGRPPNLGAKKVTLQKKSVSPEKMFLKGAVSSALAPHIIDYHAVKIKVKKTGG